jgi:hypothetical protein
MKLLLFLLITILPQTLFAQSSYPTLLSFDYRLIKQRIQQEYTQLGRFNQTGSITVKLPTQSGEWRMFEIKESPNLSEALNLQHPELQTYSGVCTEDKSLSIRFDISPMGFSGVFIQHGDFLMIEPRDLSKNIYQITSLDESQNHWRCGLEYPETRNLSKTKSSKNTNISAGSVVRTYRMAVATTGEFTVANGGQANALTRINSFLTIINAMYIKELSIDFILVSGNNIIFTDPNSDPYTISSSFSSGQSGTAFIGFDTDGKLPFANYDIGFTLHATTTTGSSISSAGVATLGVVCSDYFKGRMWTQYTASNTNANINSVVGGILIHEIAHQFGAEHTFNGQGSNCTSQLGDQFEPGSGTTIMSYKGLCSSAQNLTGNKDNYFHIRSLESILLGISFNPTCGSTVSSTNTLPVVNAGTDYTIPANTPFLLKGSASDGNNDPLTYTWDENDEGVYNDAGALGQTNGIGGYSAVRSRTAPLFRSRQSATTPNRFFPANNFVLNNANNPADNEGEDLSIANRVMKFTLTVRDNKTTGGGTVSDDVLVTVDSLKGPFLVTYPNTNINWVVGTPQTITWSVNGTDALSANIDIQISTNGGTSFSTLLSNTPNDGSETIVMPTNLALNTTARIRIVSTNSTTAEFFDISDANFSVIASPCPANNATFLSTKSGLWNDLTVWNCGNRLPNSTDTVRIVAGHVVTLNTDAQIKALNVFGNLTFQLGRVLSY